MRLIAFIVTILLATCTLQTKASNKVEPWELGFSLDGLNVFYNLTTKGNKPIVLLKFVNENKITIEVEWDEIVAFSPDNIFQMINAGKQKFVVLPGTSNEYRLKKRKTTVIDYETISHLGFKNVRIKKGMKTNRIKAIRHF